MISLHATDCNRKLNIGRINKTQNLSLRPENWVLVSSKIVHKEHTSQGLNPHCESIKTAFYFCRFRPRGLGPQHLWRLCLGTFALRFCIISTNLLAFDINYIKLHCLKKNIPNVFSYNSRKHWRIFIIFGRNVTEKASNHMLLYFSTSPN